MKFNIRTKQQAFAFTAWLQGQMESPEFSGLEIYTKGEPKTTQQLRYLHDIITDYLMPVLFDSGNIEVRNVESAKVWIKEHCGYYEEKTMKFKGKDKVVKVYKSFRDCEKPEMSKIIDAIVRVCAFVGVVIPEPNQQGE
jgi:hypothetical protein